MDSKFDIKCGKCNSEYNVRWDHKDTSGILIGKKDASCPVCGYSGISEAKAPKKEILKG